MANAIAIVGDTGTGKTSSIMPNEAAGIIGLDPAETFIFNVKGKPLPLRGWKSKYDDTPGTGNYLASTDHSLIIRVMQQVAANRPEIKNIVLDDGQYLMSEEFMQNALKSGLIC